MPPDKIIVKTREEQSGIKAYSPAQGNESSINDITIAGKKTSKLFHICRWVCEYSRARNSVCKTPKTDFSIFIINSPGSNSRVQINPLFFF